VKGSKPFASSSGRERPLYRKRLNSLYGAHIFVDCSIFFDHKKGTKDARRAQSVFDRIDKIFRIEPLADFGRTQNKILKILKILSNLSNLPFV
jgi:hypothetical protein